jgi:hypothetical protein
MHNILILFSGFLIIGCSSTQRNTSEQKVESKTEPIITEIKKEPEITTPKVEEIETKVDNQKAEVVKSKEERKKEVIKLIPLKTDYVAVVGQKLVYTASVHGSVGNSTEVSCDGNIIKLLDSKHKYDNPSKSKMSGGDAATVKYTFEAMEVGPGTVTIVKSFRGEVQNTFELKIEVE